MKKTGLLKPTHEPLKEENSPYEKEEKGNLKQEHIEHKKEQKPHLTWPPKIPSEGSDIKELTQEQEKSNESFRKMILEKSDRISSHWIDLEKIIGEIKEKLKNTKSNTEELQKDAQNARIILEKIFLFLKKTKEMIRHSPKPFDLSKIDKEEKIRIIETFVNIITLQDKAEEWKKHKPLITELEKGPTKKGMGRDSIEKIEFLSKELNHLVDFFSTTLIKEEVIKNWRQSEISPLTQYFENHYTSQDPDNKKLNELYSITKNYSFKKRDDPYAIEVLDSLNKKFSLEIEEGLTDELWEKVADSIGEGYTQNSIQLYLSDLLEEETEKIEKREEEEIDYFFGMKKEYLPELLLESKMSSFCFKILKNEMGKEKQKWALEKEKRKMKETKNEYLLSILEKNRKIATNNKSTNEMEKVRFLDAIIKSISKKSERKNDHSFIEVTPEIVSKIRVFNYLKNEKFLRYSPIVNDFVKEVSRCNFYYGNCSEELLSDFSEQISLLPVDEEIKKKIEHTLEEKREKALEKGKIEIKSVILSYEDSEKKKEDLEKSIILLLKSLETIEYIKKDLSPQKKESFYKDICESLPKDKKQVLEKILLSNEKTYLKNSLQKIGQKINERETKIGKKPKDEKIKSLYLKDPDNFLDLYVKFESFALEKKYFKKSINLLEEKRNREKMENEVLKLMGIQYDKKNDLYYKTKGCLNTLELEKIKDEISSITSNEQRVELETKGNHTYIVPKITLHDINRLDFSYKDPISHEEQEIKFCDGIQIDSVKEFSEKLEDLDIAPAAIQKILCLSNQKIGFIPLCFYNHVIHYMNIKDTKLYVPSASDSKIVIEPLNDKSSSGYCSCRMQLVSKVKISIPSENTKFHSKSNLSFLFNKDGTVEVEHYNFDIDKNLLIDCLATDR